MANIIAVKSKREFTKMDQQKEKRKILFQVSKETEGEIAFSTNSLDAFELRALIVHLEEVSKYLRKDCEILHEEEYREDLT